MAGNQNSGNWSNGVKRSAKRHGDTLGELSDAIVRKALADNSTLSQKEKAELAIRIVVKRIPTSIAPAGEYAEFMAQMLAKGDLLARSRREQKQNN